jgi:NAD(P)-dependent dehydrogenase (short-subunit alcohol dehydrogenase family)
MHGRNSLMGRVALITGSSRGVGRAIACTLAAQGATIAINYRRDELAAAEVVAQITGNGGVARAYQAAIEDEAKVTAMVHAARADLGPLSIVVSNAGTASRGRTVAETSLSEFQSLMQVHAFGPIGLLQAALPDLRSAGRGDVVMISSTITAATPGGAAPYSMAKAAMESCVMTLAQEERSHGIRANIVAPGLVETEMGRRLVHALAGGATIDDLKAQYPFGRVCVPEDVAAVVAFLVSDEAAYITGQKILVDGGGPESRIVDRMHAANGLA